MRLYYNDTNNERPNDSIIFILTTESPPRGKASENVIKNKVWLENFSRYETRTKMGQQWIVKHWSFIRLLKAFNIKYV